MAGWDSFPIVKPAQNAAPAADDPWAAFPVTKPAAAAPTPPAPPAPPAPPMVPNPEFADLPVPTSEIQAPAAEPNLTDQIMGGLDYADNTGANFFEGARKGASASLGLPVDLLNLGLSTVGMGSDNPVGGSKSIDSLLTGFGMVPDAPEPTDGFQRIAGRVGQEIGATAVPAAGMVGSFGGAGLAAGKAAPGLARLFGAEAAAVNPASFLGKEAMFATGAGMGAGVANEAFGNQDQSNPWIDAGGAVAGAGATGLGTAVLQSGADIGRAFFGGGSFQDEVVKEAVMRDLAASAGITAREGEAPDITSIINAAENNPRVSDAIPGYQESLADRTKVPGIAALEYSRQSGPNAGAYTQQRANNTAAVDAAMSPLGPDATPGQFSTALEQNRTAAVSQATGTRDAAQTAFDTATRDLVPALTAEGRGANIRTALQDASGAAKEILGEAWRPLDEANQSVDVDILRAAFDDAASTVPKALQPKLPAAADVPRQLVDPENPETIMQPLSEVMGIRSALTDDLRAAGTTPQQKRLIEDHVKRLDQYLDQNVPPDLRQQYDDAKRATVDFNDRFTRPQTAIGQTLAEREGLPRGPDSTVAGKFVQSDQGRISDFEALMKEAGSDERVQTAVRDQVLQDVNSRGLLDKPDALNDYLGQYGTVFGKFPDLKAQLGNAGSLRKALTETQTAADDTIRQLTQPGQERAVANYLKYGDEKADQAMKNVLASAKPARTIDELLAFVGDAPDAVEGARKVFWDIMQGKSRAGGRTTMDVNGAQPWSPKALSDFLGNPTNAAVAERLYKDNPEHLTRIREIAEALDGVDIRNAAKAPNSSGTAQGLSSNLLTPEALQSRGYAYMSGRISGTFLVTSIVSVLVRRGVRKAQEQGYQRMMDDILTNADTAALMMKENNPAARQALARKAKGWFGNEASTIINAMSGDDDEDETTKAAMRMEALN